MVDFLAGKMDIINAVSEGSLHIVNAGSGGNLHINAGSGGNLHIVNAGSGGNLNIVNPGSGGKLNIVNPGSGGNLHIVNAGSGGNLHIVDAGSGRNLNIVNADSGRNLNIVNAGSGRNLNIFNAGSGRNLNIVNPDSRGNLNIFNPDSRGNLNIFNPVSGRNINIFNPVSGGNIKIFNPVSGGNIKIFNPVSGGNIKIFNPVSGGNIKIFNPVSGGNIKIFNLVAGGKIKIIHPVSGGKINIIHAVSGGKINIILSDPAGKIDIINPVLPDPAWKDSIGFSRMKMEGSSIQHRSQNQQAEILLKEGLLSEPGKMNIINKMDFFTPVVARNRDIIKMKGFSIQYRSLNQQAEFLSNGALLNEPVNIDAANACVVTPRGKLQADELITAYLFRENAPSVVYISNIAVRQNAFTPRHLVEQGYGTGFFWDEKGYIVTNYHVIQGASNLRVKLHDKSEYAAELIGGNLDTDVAVLVIDTPKKLRPVLVGSSRNLKEGQNVYAIGNPFHFDCSLTTGIISKLGGQINSPANGNPISNVIHITATISPGSSGGPLFESSGSLIGINTAMHTISGVSTGFGFSIPVDTFSYHVSSIVDQFEASKKNETHTGIRFAPDLSVEQLGVAGVPLQMGQQEKQDRS